MRKRTDQEGDQITDYCGGRWTRGLFLWVLSRLERRRVIEVQDLSDEGIVWGRDCRREVGSGLLKSIQRLTEIEVWRRVLKWVVRGMVVTL